MMDLPVETIACILRLTTPRDAKRMAAVNKTFLEASRSDLVWENFLPPHWEDLFHTTPPSLMQVYDQLCEGVCEQGDTNKIYTIDRPTGFLTRFLGAAAEGLVVVWGDHPQYWNWIEGQSTRVKKVAYLKLVWWLEIKGTFKGLWSPGKYSVAFRLQLKKSRPLGGRYQCENMDIAKDEENDSGRYQAGNRGENVDMAVDEENDPAKYQGGNVDVAEDEYQRNVYWAEDKEYEIPGKYQVGNQAGYDAYERFKYGNYTGDLDDSEEEEEEEEQAEEEENNYWYTWGWETCPPIKFKLMVDGMIQESSAYLHLPKQEVPGWSLAPTREMDDSWVEFEIGEFTVEGRDYPVELEFSMMQIEGEKSGLLVEGLIIKQIE